MVQPSN